MKKILLMLAAAVPALLFAQTPDNYSIKGKVGALNVPARAYLIYERSGKNVTDSTNIINGDFKFHGNITEPASAVIVIDPHGLGLNKWVAESRKSKQQVDLLDFFVDKANMVLPPVDSISRAVVTGSKVNDDDKALNETLNPFRVRAGKISNDFQALNDAQRLNPTYQDAISAQYKIVQNDQTEAIKTFIGTHPQSYISLICMRMLIKGGSSISDMEGYFTKLAPAIQQTELGKGFASAINELKITAIGAMAPDFTQNDVNGVPVKLSSFRGKYVLIDFWASWCGPCRQENPHVVRVFDKYKDKNFTILGVSLDKAEEKSNWLAAIKDDGLSWTQVSDLKYWLNEAAGMYRISFIPQNYLIDPTGKIVAKNLKGADLDAKMAEIFKM